MPSNRDYSNRGAEHSDTFRRAVPKCYWRAPIAYFELTADFPDIWRLEPITEARVGGR